MKTVQEACRKTSETVPAKMDFMAPSCDETTVSNTSEYLSLVMGENRLHTILGETVKKTVFETTVKNIS